MMFYVFGNINAAILKNDPSKPFKNKWCDAWEIDRINGEAERCPECGRYVSMLEWLSPRKIRLTNTRYPDRLSTWLTEPLVVSGRFVEAYNSAGLVGVREFIQIDKVTAPNAGANTRCPPNYYCAKIDYTQKVRVDYEKSKIYGQKYDWSCSLCNPMGTTKDKVERIVIDTKEWDGEDIFRVYGLGIVVSQRFYDFVSTNNFTNFNLVPIHQYQMG